MFRLNERERHFDFQFPGSQRNNVGAGRRTTDVRWKKKEKNNNQ